MSQRHLIQDFFSWASQVESFVSHPERNSLTCSFFRKWKHKVLVWVSLWCHWLINLTCSKNMTMNWFWVVIIDIQYNNSNKKKRNNYIKKCWFLKFFSIICLMFKQRKTSHSSHHVSIQVKSRVFNFHVQVTVIWVDSSLLKYSSCKCNELLPPSGWC